MYHQKREHKVIYQLQKREKNKTKIYIGQQIQLEQFLNIIGSPLHTETRRRHHQQQEQVESQTTHHPRQVKKKLLHSLFFLLVYIIKHHI